MKTSKKLRKKIKAERIRNKKLIKKYPWLYPRNSWTGKKIKPYDYSFTELDFIPAGWMKTFGDMMCEEIHQELIRTHYVDKFVILQAKEKYGSMRIYTGSLPSDSHVWEIIEKYSILSENICATCGRPDVPQTNGGWIIPICKRCWAKQENKRKMYFRSIDKEYTPAIYEDCMYMKDSRMANEMHWRRFDKDGDKDFTINISDTANKIRARWHIDTE